MPTRLPWILLATAGCLGVVSASQVVDWTKISPEGAIERFINAAGEYYEAGGEAAVMRGLQIDEGEVKVPRVLVFGQEEARAAPWNVACFRIPAVLQTDDGVLLAFAEARVDTCADCAELGIALRRSDDGGETWGNVTWPVPPTPTGPGREMARGGNPTVAWDSLRQQVVLHFNRGTTEGGDCIPAVDNFQVTSPDSGLTWGPVRNISAFLLQYRGLLPGPGTGAYLPAMDRMVMAGHYLTAEREGGAVVIYYSDDGGETWQLSPSTFPKADESSVAAVGETELVVNLRRDVNDCSLCPPKGGGCNCRGRAFSTDSGATWSTMELDPQLPDPICEGSIAQVGPYTVFSNPPMSFARANLSLALSSSGGRGWDHRIQITDEFQYTDYSSLATGALVRGPPSEHPVAGLLWGSCLHPIPMRVWCLWPTSWEVYFSRVPLDPATFGPA